MATRNAGYQTANVVQQQYDTAEALTNLANATLEDRNAVANLTAANLNLTNYLAKKDEEITRVKREIVILQKKLGTKRMSTNNGGNSRKYCWSHGMNASHTSKQCHDKQEGHQDEATAKNTMGGNQFGVK